MNVEDILINSILILLKFKFLYMDLRLVFFSPLVYGVSQMSSQDIECILDVYQFSD